jgi:hypothetical protein
MAARPRVRGWLVYQALLTVGVLALCVAATAGTDDSVHRPVAVAVGGVAVLALPTRPDPSGARPGPRTTGWGVWPALTAAVAAFQVANFVQSPRDTYPTVSSIINLAFESHATRAAGFAGWLALGWYLLRR